jgi:hypothetical protein
VLLDWIECTIQGVVSVILRKLRAFFLPDWTDLESGGLGYNKSAIVWKNGRVLWHTERADMGVHIRLPASALQLGGDPVAILTDLDRMGAACTRLDIAADDFKGLLDMDVLLDKIVKGEFVCRSRIVDQVRRLRGGSGNTLYFGSRRSDTFFRIYDKAAEQAQKGALFLGPWVRAEMELKNERAEKMGRVICENGETWLEMARGLFLSFLEFKEHQADPNKSRWPTFPAWLTFLEEASKFRLFISREVKTVDDLIKWVTKQTTPTLFVLAATIGHDELFRMIGEGATRLSPRQIEMIESYAQTLRERSEEE